MYLKSVELHQFRSYDQRVIAFDSCVNIILGPNAIGKTNVLEAIHLLTGAGSFRTGKKLDFIRWGCEVAQVKGRVFTRERDFDLTLTLPLSKPSFASINGVKKPVAKGLSEVLKCVVFCPEDLFIVSSSPALRRGFMDKALCQLRPNYAALLSKYQRLMEGKNRILRNWDTATEFRDILPEYTDKMAMLSAQIIQYRHLFIQTICPVACEIQTDISNGREALSLTYRTVSTVTNSGGSLPALYQEVLAHAKAHEDAEIASRTCLTGIHKDDFDIAINGKSAKNYGSQGQTRSVALALKLAEHHLFYRDLGEYPLLLLDDVFSELDSQRRRYIMEKVGTGQVIITSCYEENLPTSATVVRIE